MRTLMARSSFWRKLPACVATATLPLEEYLRGVVPLELPPSSFPEIEALKAQAIAARCYALSTRGRFTREGFDLYDDARPQIYRGLSAEQPLTNRAVEETRGLVAVYPNEAGRLVPIEALYTSNCGGHTENNEAVFLTKAVPYLRGVECRPDRGSSSDRQIASAASVEPIVGSDGRSKARDASLLPSMNDPPLPWAGFGERVYQIHSDRSDVFRAATNGSDTLLATFVAWLVSNI